MVYVLLMYFSVCARALCVGPTPHMRATFGGWYPALPEAALPPPHVLYSEPVPLYPLQGLTAVASPQQTYIGHRISVSAGTGHGPPLPGPPSALSLGVPIRSRTERLTERPPLPARVAQVAFPSWAP